ncbi:uncharacterized protein BO80DRAFT_27823 [Aspergillus ibericus CBS 121593]|uniref:HTH araC/xylS-type domain-containing protein n=1 Tax=Aspergillus ibericus CBS 121593 TaxID=1448316 RepID=A0A395H435_9EURO|nr:hypothetical protein BO80DRAFT_27823 [Aspergillus ibericus CBS 121593]RAL02642.1 hypothetical protein BO80DRAFT_27823 [Aspergillus ibericus CBS 121593]
MQTEISSASNCSNMYQSSHSRWNALAHRAPSSHSSFIYGVKSTNIYCRPTCPARLARRANIIFYDTAVEARRDGFRPCKRCKPDTAEFLGEGEEVVIRVIALLRIKQDDQRIKRGLKDLARDVGVSPSYLCRVFKKTMGITIGSYKREFEKEATHMEAETDTITASPETFGPWGMDAGTEPTSDIIAERPAVLVKEPDSGLEEDMGSLPDALNFNLDDWFRFEDFWNQGSTTTSVG